MTSHGLHVWWERTKENVVQITSTLGVVGDEYGVASTIMVLAEKKEEKHSVSKTLVDATPYSPTVNGRPGVGSERVQMLDRLGCERVKVWALCWSPQANTPRASCTGKAPWCPEYAKLVEGTTVQTKSRQAQGVISHLLCLLTALAAVV